MKIKIKGPNPFQIQFFDNMLPKLSRILKIKGQDAESKIEAPRWTDEKRPRAQARGSWPRDCRGNTVKVAFPQLINRDRGSVKKVCFILKTSAQIFCKKDPLQYVQSTSSREKKNKARVKDLGFFVRLV